VTDQLNIPNGSIRQCNADCRGGRDGNSVEPLAPACERGGGRGNHAETHKDPPPVRFCVRGRWRRQLGGRDGVEIERYCQGHGVGWHHDSEWLLVGFYTVVVSRWWRREDSSYAPSDAPTRWVSPLVYYLPPTHMPTQNPSTLKLVGLHLSLEGRGQVATSVGVVGPKKNKGG